ncbi:hypothetical protein HDU87_005312 [Geranomyces variabilis]|uniref:Uncharacterized protein n=1 Tax=Geranomyces variabilis TaxID=109894 RepID=A0AAD5XRD6_9FUNG|nr:hypothetical protein HDU87_005312 [Geranomyces variabilis]
MPEERHTVEDSSTMLSTPTREALAGFAAGTVSTALLHPMDLVKTRLQLNALRKFRPSGLRMLINIWQSEGGMRGIYRGVSANLVGAAAWWTLYFWWYALFKEHAKLFDLGGVQHFVAAAQAGLLTAAITNPLWVIKVRMCATHATDCGAYKSVTDGLTRTWRHEGIRGLYKGTFPAILGVGNGALQLAAYEELKKRRRPRPATDAVSTAEYASMAAASKMFASLCTYPLQIVRARMQWRMADVGGFIETAMSAFR